MNAHTHTLQTHFGRDATRGASGATLLARAFDTLALWRARGRERRALGELPDALLKDIGVSRADARREAAKPFWRA